MKRRFLSALCWLLLTAMLLSSLASCDGGEDITTDVETKTSVEDTSSIESDELTESSSVTEAETETEVESESETHAPLVGENAELIENAYSLANGVQAYYVDNLRDELAVENKEMVLTYSKSGDAKLVSSLTDKSGHAYLENTMDVFVRMSDGKTYYASESLVAAQNNIFRLGYYYYDVRFENQMFSGGETVELAIDHTRYDKSATKKVEVTSDDNDILSLKILDQNDPHFVLRNVKFSAEEYKFLEITMKADKLVGGNAELFIIAGSATGYSDTQRISFNVTADGQYHTYTLALDSLADYAGNVRGIRLDINGEAGATFEISGIKAVGFAAGSPASLALSRGFLAYSDKMHHLIQIAAKSKTEGIEAVGMLTEIPEEKVTSLIVKDANGTHESIADVDWASAEYVGFDIVDAGIFGYILPYDGSGGSIKVELIDGVYVIEQTRTPENKMIIPSEAGTDNANDFYMGQRVYTDDSHDFTEFLYEAYCERNPLTSENFQVDTLMSTNGSYVGYDALRGIYRFNVAKARGFNGPFYDYPNRHFNVTFTVNGDETDRSFYIMAYTATGTLECAALLDGDMLMLPVPVEVGKNFKGDKDDNIFSIDDVEYGEAILPLTVKAGEEKRYTVLNMYQNWGDYPLKQISFIRYSSPYYHLSLGVTETNCIVPYGSQGLGLPDFRSVSAPYWEGQPQHNSCGIHRFLRYTDADGNLNYTKHQNTEILSYGPTYADMTMDYISTDGKIRATYRHMEMPQTDENRSFYEMKIEVLEDVSILNFKENFSFYSVRPNDPTGKYTQIGYLDTNNASQVVTAVTDDTVKEYVLGYECPYFSFFNMENCTSESQQGYSNVAFLVYNSDLTVNGEKCNAPFIIRNFGDTVAVTLDLGDVTLKAGDVMTINAILMPWGSQESDYSGDAPDKNVRDVRENTLLDPITMTADGDCEVVESVYLPTVRTTDGKTAEFTVSGGHNNVTIRVEGFERLTVPVIQEKIDGRWRTLELSSSDNPDKAGYGYYYDGYAVHYDGDGTYSYSFVTAMDNGEPKSFRVRIVKEFEGWPAASVNTDPINLYSDPAELSRLDKEVAGLTFEVIEEEGESYIRYYGKGSGEGYIIPFNDSSKSIVTGQYLVMKYRYPTSNTVNFTTLEIFANTQKSLPPNGTDDRILCPAPVQDGEWHILVIDVSGLNMFLPAADGQYYAQFFRVDVLNRKADASNCVDIAYFGMSDSIEKICKLAADAESIDLYQDVTMKSIDVATATVMEPPKEPLNVYLDPTEIAGLSMGGCTATLAEDESYVTLSREKKGEGYVFPYDDAGAVNVTGQYIVFKYRITDASVAKFSNFEIFSSTKVSLASIDVNARVTFGGIEQDGEWHLMIFDASAIDGFEADGNGEYRAKYVRFDVFNMVSDAACIDFAYIGISDNLDDVWALETELATATLIAGDAQSEITRP